MEEIGLIIVISARAVGVVYLGFILNRYYKKGKQPKMIDVIVLMTLIN